MQLYYFWCQKNLLLLTNLACKNIHDWHAMISIKSNIDKYIDFFHRWKIEVQYSSTISSLLCTTIHIYLKYIHLPGQLKYSSPHSAIVLLFRFTRSIGSYRDQTVCRIMIGMHNSNLIQKHGNVSRNYLFGN